MHSGAQVGDPVPHAQGRIPRLRLRQEGRFLGRGARRSIAGWKADFVSRLADEVTALSPAVGFDNAPVIAHKASDESTTLRESTLASGDIGAEEFDRVDDQGVIRAPLSPNLLSRRPEREGSLQ